MSSRLFRTKDGRVRTWVVSIVLAVLAPCLAGCYGSFQVTKVVYKFNGEVSNDKLVRSLVMWGFVILPVYYVAVLADGVVLNPIEYWNGTQINVTQGPDAPGGSAALAPTGEGRRAVPLFAANGQALATPTQGAAPAGQPGAAEVR